MSTLHFSRNVVSRSIGSGIWSDDGDYGDDDSLVVDLVDGDAANLTPTPREPCSPTTRCGKPISALLPTCGGGGSSISSETAAQHEHCHDGGDSVSSFDAIWSDERVQAVAQLWGFNAAKTADLFDMRERLRGVLPPTSRLNDPGVIVRFLRPRQKAGQNDYCFQKIVKCLKWRAAHNMDDLLVHYQPSPDFMAGHYPCAVLVGCDHEGDPVALLRPGSGNSHGLIRHYGAEECAKYLRWLQEQVCFGEWRQEWEETHQRPIKQLLHVEDFLNVYVHQKGVSLWLDQCKINAMYYPEVFRRSVLVGIPSVLVRVYDAAKYMFKKEDRDKLLMTGPSMYRETLAQLVDFRILPVEMVEEGKGRPMINFPYGFKCPDQLSMDYPIKIK